MSDVPPPWLPEDIDETFDPLEHADIEPSPETPLIVTPRGGDREVGRSCYQVDTQHGRYLVDCGLSQGTSDKFPDLRGLQPQSIDAVFLTHAHVDHCGGLPVLENRNLLADNAPVVTTPPTASIASLMLEDSLKIHRRETDGSSAVQQFTSRDVAEVCDRFHTVGYGGGRIEGVAPVSDVEPAIFQLGNTAHLLGSAWVVIQTSGYRVCFSGDLGGRATHLPDMSPPPESGLLMLESTYGDTHSHPSLSGARTGLWEDIERAIQTREPVLIPTFAIGRAQTILLIIAERLHTLSADLRDRVEIVLDGMAVEGTDIYHEYVEDTNYFAESLVNRVVESGETEPFFAESFTIPETDQDRQKILTRAARDGTVPVIISPSGMLTGGNSPRYLAEFTARFGNASVFLTGYQAANTTGRTLQSQYQADQETVSATIDATPFSTDWPESSDVQWVHAENTGDSELKTRISFSADWISLVEGLSGHAAQSGLLSFARTVAPDTIGLIHGPDYAQERLGPHLAENVAGVDQVTRSRRMTPIAVGSETDVDTAVISPEEIDSTGYTELEDQIDHLYELLSKLNEEVASARNEPGLSEAEIREVIQDEMEIKE
ncbi:MBL fold metallo-hydrolase [Halorubrum sp. GN11GM_10-3_MGM]|uniref:MBL fold metallo-hydrolase n=1 Tax=Halorubrum sp. GN11GM_10-3_MGM TaxID=2518111 RepID=UPI0010F670BA|nr:MBL fold metallo-hydrolase [Halorubrum sp. GN11GM_10-3_MGM]TKX72387.1 MBL fold metallo-hydrolase [Halorubrum sp. GN11GM_10-3_MGM]